MFVISIFRGYFWLKFYFIINISIFNNVLVNFKPVDLTVFLTTSTFKDAFTLFLDTAVITAFLSFIPVITPFTSTDAIFSLLEIKVNDLSSAFGGRIIACGETLLPFSTFILLLLEDS